MTRRAERIVAAALGRGGQALGWSGTFHAIGARLVRQHARDIGLDPAFTILDREDAAGLIDPLSGDGIYEALLSSRLAAEAVLDLLAGRQADLAPYAARIERELAPMISASWSAKLAFDRFPRLAFTIARTPPAWRLAERLRRPFQESARRDFRTTRAEPFQARTTSTVRQGLVWPQ